MENLCFVPKWVLMLLKMIECSSLYLKNHTLILSGLDAGDHWAMVSIPFCFSPGVYIKVKNVKPRSRSVSGGTAFSPRPQCAKWPTQGISYVIFNVPHSKYESKRCLIIVISAGGSLKVFAIWGIVPCYTTGPSDRAVDDAVDYDDDVLFMVACYLNSHSGAVIWHCYFVQYK